MTKDVHLFPCVWLSNLVVVYVHRFLSGHSKCMGYRFCLIFCCVLIGYYQSMKWRMDFS